MKNNKAKTNWRVKLQSEYKKKNFEISKFVKENFDDIEGACWDYKRKRVVRVIKNLEKYGTVDNQEAEGVNTKKRTAIVENDGTVTGGFQGFSYENGNYISDRIISVSKGQPITPDIVMEAHGLDKRLWEVVSYKNNFWNAQAQEGKVVELYQSKLVVKPRISPELSFEDIDNFFKNKDFTRYINNTTKNIVYNDSDEVLEIDTADLHCGLLAWRNETGSDYDLKICANKFLGAIDDIVQRSEHKQFSDIYFCGLGDILHIDNDKNETTKGTLQQAEGRMAKIFDFAFDTINTAIYKLRVNFPDTKLHYMYLAGNHDRNTGYFLAKCLQLANDDVDFDIRPNPQKAIHFGKVLVGLTHGDMPTKNKGTWLINDFRKEFGESHFVEEHSGHFHEEEARKYNGIMVRSVVAQCGNSYWEHQQGYRSQRGIQCFVWNKMKGLRETWYYYY